MLRCPSPPGAADHARHRERIEAALRSRLGSSAERSDEATLNAAARSRIDALLERIPGIAAVQVP